MEHRLESLCATQVARPVFLTCARPFITRWSATRSTFDAWPSDGRPGAILICRAGIPACRRQAGALALQYCRALVAAVVSTGQNFCRQWRRQLQRQKLTVVAGNAAV